MGYFATESPGNIVLNIVWMLRVRRIKKKGKNNKEPCKEIQRGPRMCRLLFLESPTDSTEETDAHPKHIKQELAESSS